MPIGMYRTSPGLLFTQEVELSFRLTRRKTKVFRFTPTPVRSVSYYCLMLSNSDFLSRIALLASSGKSSFLLLEFSDSHFHRWCGANGFAHRQCILDTNISQWFDPQLFPPLSVFYGSEDYLVDSESLLARLKEKESVNVIRTEKLPCEVGLAASFPRAKH